MEANPNRRKRRILQSVFVPLTLAALLAGCHSDSAKKPDAEGGPPPMPVKMVVAQPVPVNDSSEYVATLKSRNFITLSPQVDGQIRQIFVTSGERVAKGAPIMEIDPLKQQATTNTQEANRAAKVASLQYAQQQFDRISKLYADGVASKESYDQARSALDAAKADLNALDAQVREQQVQLQYYHITAPKSGIVGDIPVHVGDRVTSATVLTTIDQPGNIEAYIDVPVERAHDLALGKPVQLIDASGKIIAESRISFISPSVNDQTQSILVKAQFENNKGTLRPSQFTRARIIWGSHPGILIPVLAVNRINGQFFAFLAEPGEKPQSLVARQKQIQVGNIVDNDYVVLSGINPGDRIIVSGTQYLGEGAPVQGTA